MKKTSNTGRYPELQLFIGTPSGPVPLTAHSSGIALPPNPAFETPTVQYGPYLLALGSYFSANSHRNLKRLIKAALKTFSLSELHGQVPDEVSIISEKHGALYNVSCIRIGFKSNAAGAPLAHPTIFELALNTALLPQQQAFLRAEYRLLRRLHKRFTLPWLPRPLLFARTAIKEDGVEFPIEFFASEWFENHHEFHLEKGNSVHPAANPLEIHVWKPGTSDLYLRGMQAEDLYAGAATILTACLDTEGFKQVYPWHHAAGDFVLDDSRAPISVKLITARDYRSLLPPGTDTSDKMLGSLHFLINMSIRLRIDRIAGTGDLAWSGNEAARGCVRGFSEAWKVKESADPQLPGADQIFTFFLRFSYEEQLAFAEIASRDGQLEGDESSFVAAHLPEHLRALTASFAEFLDRSTGD
ncbi:MAG: hypothetical protein AAGU11_15450 [Syntrophobacteraceae bacterium]